MTKDMRHDFTSLKNPMEEKRLNLHRPLLSLRRFPSTISTKTDEEKRTRRSLSNPELKSVRVRGTIPFVWEQSPGRPKANTESHAQTCSPVIPKSLPEIVSGAKLSVPGNAYKKQVVSSVGDNAVAEKHCSDSGDSGKACVDSSNTLQLTGVANKEKRPMGVPLKIEPRNLEGSSLYRRLQGSGFSLPENEFPQSRYLEREISIDGRNGFASAKRSNSFRVFNQTTDRKVRSRNYGAEITAYVDFLHKVVSPKTNSSSSNRKGLPNSINHDVEVLARVTDEKLNLPNKRLNHADPGVLSSSRKSDQESRRMMRKGFGKDQHMSQTTIISANPELPDNRCIDIEDAQQLLKVGNVKTRRGNDSKLPVLPPLPRPPSQSWLCHALSHMSSRDSSSCSHLGMRKNPRHSASNKPCSP